MAGWTPRVRRFSHPDGDGPLAILEVLEQPPSGFHIELAAAIPRRRADRRRYAASRLPPGTLELCGLVLPDAGRIQEEDARQANKYKYSKHEPAQPLFTENDAVRALTQLQPIGYEKQFDLGKGLGFDFLPAGMYRGKFSNRVHAS